MWTRKILHIDMDCFFAAVEIRDNPDLKGKNVVVGGSPSGRGVIVAASYEARRFGVRSAMSSFQAVKLCPHLVFVKSSFSKYKDESAKIFKIFKEYTPLVEGLSLDEAFLDVTEILKGPSDPLLLAEEIRGRIREETGLTASAGIASNKFLAKIASDWRKPDGQYAILPDEIEAFVKVLPVEKIPGVGKVTAKKMHELGLKTCGDVQLLSQADVVQKFGSWGFRLHQLSRGYDVRQVKPHRLRKSFSVERTFDKDLSNPQELKENMRSIYRSLGERWQRSGIDEKRISGVVLKLKYHDFQIQTHEAVYAGSFPDIKVFGGLMQAAWKKKSIRLMGMGFKLKSPDQVRAETDQLKLFE